MEFSIVGRWTVVGTERNIIFQFTSRSNGTLTITSFGGKTYEGRYEIEKSSDLHDIKMDRELLNLIDTVSGKKQVGKVDVISGTTLHITEVDPASIIYKALNVSRPSDLRGIVESNGHVQMILMKIGGVASEVASDGKTGWCYIATCVYGAYDCPELWILRRFRDNILARSWYGRKIIVLYYAISPKIVRHFGKRTWFKMLCRPILNKVIYGLHKKGISSNYYTDKTVF